MNIPGLHRTRRPFGKRVDTRTDTGYGKKIQKIFAMVTDQRSKIKKKIKKREGGSGGVKDQG